MIKIVIADDLTGAFDIAEHGIDLFDKIKVIPYPPENFNMKKENVDLLVFSTETRNVTSEEARDRIINFLEKIKDSNYQLIFKKIDSTLRGNVKIENEEFLKFYRKLCLIPANPELGRTVENGLLYINGEEYSKTHYCRTEEKNMKDFLSEVDGYTPDLKTNEDFKDIVLKLKGNENIFPVGSSGFFREFVKISTTKKSKNMRRTLKIKGKILFLNGSLNSVSASDEKLFSDYGIEKVSLENIPVNSENSLIVNTKDIKKYFGLFIYKSQLKRLLNNSSFDFVIISGGETLKEFCSLMEIKEITVNKSIDNGIPAFTHKFGRNFSDVISKPGGYKLSENLIDEDRLHI